MIPCKRLQHMLKVCTIRRDARVTVTDHALADTSENTWICLNICNSANNSCFQIHIRFDRCSKHRPLSAPQRKISMLFKSGERGVPGNPVYSSVR